MNYYSLKPIIDVGETDRITSAMDEYFMNFYPEIGYDVRCVNPCSFDISYCSQMAWGVWTLFHRGETGCMVHIDDDGHGAPLYLKDLQDPQTGKINPRLVDIDGEKVQNIFNYDLHYITPDDYDAARKYVSNPEDYDFHKILNW